MKNQNNPLPNVEYIEFNGDLVTRKWRDMFIFGYANPYADLEYNAEIKGQEARKKDNSIKVQRNFNIA